MEWYHALEKRENLCMFAHMSLKYFWKDTQETNTGYPWGEKKGSFSGCDEEFSLYTFWILNYVNVFPLQQKVYL